MKRRSDLRLGLDLLSLRQHLRHRFKSLESLCRALLQLTSDLRQSTALRLRDLRTFASSNVSHGYSMRRRRSTRVSSAGVYWLLWMDM